MRSLLLVAVLVSACGPDFTDRIAECGVEVQNESLTPYENLSYRFWLARKILIRDLVPEDRFCEAFSGLLIRVHDAPSWKVSSGQEVLGIYNHCGTRPVVQGCSDQPVLQTGSTQGSLIHEMMHRWDAVTAAPNWNNHFDWESRGGVNRDRIESEYLGRHSHPFRW